MSTLTTTDVLDIIAKRAQWCREEGESDMRNILYTVSFLRDKIKEGKSREEILAEWYDDDDEE